MTRFKLNGPLQLQQVAQSLEQVLLGLPDQTEVTVANARLDLRLVRRGVRQAVVPDVPLALSSTEILLPSDPNELSVFLGSLSLQNHAPEPINLPKARGLIALLGQAHDDE